MPVASSEGARAGSIFEEKSRMCLYAFMRTTVMLPPELMRAAKARSAERGESLKSLLTRAVEAELGRGARPAPARTPVALPMFGREDGPPVRVSNADLERALADVDLTHATGRPAAPTRRPTRRVR
jgi:hypothetical protein